jgi:hypothetical protein
MKMPVTDIQYLLPYVESYGIDGSTKYTDRWVGVFNRFSPERAGQNLWIILHPKQNSEAQQRIESAAEQALGFCNYPSLLHLVILSSYMGNWRFCIQNLGEEVERMVCLFYFYISFFHFMLLYSLYSRCFHAFH